MECMGADSAINMYVRQLTEDDHAEEVCEQICQTIYDIAMMRKKDDQNGEA